MGPNSGNNQNRFRFKNKSKGEGYNRVRQVKVQTRGVVHIGKHIQNRQKKKSNNYGRKVQKHRRTLERVGAK